MKKLWQLGFMLVMAFTLLVGCGQSDSKKPEAENKTTQSANKTATYPMTVTDDTGNKVEFKQEPTKIVSLMPSNTEILFALGLDDHVIGVTDNDTYPEAATKKDKVGGMELNTEKIISLKPDAVFAHGMIAESAKSGIQQLRDAGIPVFVVKNASNFDETYETIKTIGKITNRSAKADQIVEDMKAKVKDVQANVADVKQRNVFVENSDEPEIYTAGKDTFMQEILNLANVKNAADDQSGWFKIDPEEIIKRDPDVYLITYNYVPNIVEKVKKRQGFKDLKAIKNDRVIQVDPDKTSRPGPRLAEGLEEVAKAVYPEAFK